MALPNPSVAYDFDWANQYTRELETQLIQLQTQIQQLRLFELPQYTTAQKNTLSNVKGRLVFDTTLGKACVNNGTTWETIQSV